MHDLRDHRLNHHSTDQETSSMHDLDTLARVGRAERESEIRHHLEERALALAALDHQRRATETSIASNGSVISRLVARIAPPRTAATDGPSTTTESPAPRLRSECPRGLDCGQPALNRPA